MIKILDTVLSHNEHWRPEGIDFSVSELSNSSSYQLWHRMNGTKELDRDKDLDSVVSSVIGTGFHLLAENILKQFPEVNTEVSMETEMFGYKISGTSDVIYLFDGQYVIGDFKTKGNYQMKKAILGNNEQERLQLSMYAYMYSKINDVDIYPYGELYLVRTGDKGFFTKKECEQYSIPEDSKSIPNRYTKSVPLYDDEELERIILNKIDMAKEGRVDCEPWRCAWCSYDCEYRDAIPSVDSQF